MQNFSHVVSEGNGRWFQPRRCWKQFAGWSAVYLLVLLYVGLHLGWWSSLETSPLAGTAEPPNLELSEVDDPDGEAVPHIENPKGAPRQPTAGSCNVGHGDPERRVSGSNSRGNMLTGNNNALSVAAAILGNVVSVTPFDMLVLFTEVIDHEHGRALTIGQSRDGSVQWHWTMATTRGDHISEQLFENFRDAGSPARVSLVSKHNDLRGRGLQAEQVLAVVRCSLNFVAVTFGTDLLFTASCSRHMPFVFARLLSPRREDVQSTLRHLELFFLVMVSRGPCP